MKNNIQNYTKETLVFGDSDFNSRQFAILGNFKDTIFMNI